MELRRAAAVPHAHAHAAALLQLQLLLLLLLLRDGGPTASAAAGRWLPLAAAGLAAAGGAAIELQAQRSKLGAERRRQAAAVAARQQAVQQRGLACGMATAARAGARIPAGQPRAHAQRLPSRGGGGLVAAVSGEARCNEIAAAPPLTTLAAT